jgi:hypothetical protein
VTLAGSISRSILHQAADFVPHRHLARGATSSGEPFIQALDADPSALATLPPAAFSFERRLPAPLAMAKLMQGQARRLVRRLRAHLHRVFSPFHIPEFHDTFARFRHTGMIARDSLSIRLGRAGYCRLLLVTNPTTEFPDGYSSDAFLLPVHDSKLEVNEGARLHRGKKTKHDDPRGGDIPVPTHLLGSRA